MTEIILQKNREFFANNDCYDLHFTKGLHLTDILGHLIDIVCIHRFIWKTTMLPQYKPM